MPDDMGFMWKTCVHSGSLMCFQWGNDARVEILECVDQDCFKVAWTVSLLRVVEDCLGNVIQISCISQLIHSLSRHWRWSLVRGPGGAGAAFPNEARQPAEEDSLPSGGLHSGETLDSEDHLITSNKY